ncbi:FGGY family carbohydrate kinase, partial [Vibrio sp. NO3-D2]|nr:FGGY family carbohydrate kinase [Vibrio sp. NO3-D2]
ASKYADQINQQHDGFNIYRRTGTPIHPMSPLSKIFWMKHEQPDIFNHTALFADIKTYILYQLYETYVIDHSMASATGMFNLEQLDWDDDASKYADQINQQHDGFNIYRRTGTPIHPMSPLSK